MLRTDLRRMTILLSAATLSCLAVGGCGGGQKAAGNAVEMHDMEVVDGTVNDSMTDLDAVKADGVGAADNSGNASRPVNRSSEDEGNVAGAEAVPIE